MSATVAISNLLFSPIFVGPPRQNIDPRALPGGGGLKTGPPIQSPWTTSPPLNGLILFSQFHAVSAVLMIASSVLTTPSNAAFATPTPAENASERNPRRPSVQPHTSCTWVITSPITSRMKPNAAFATPTPRENATVRIDLNDSVQHQTSLKLAITSCPM